MNKSNIIEELSTDETNKQKNKLSDSAVITQIANRNPNTSTLLLNDKPKIGSLVNSIKAVF